MNDPAVGDQLDQYQLTELLARGGMASVFRARDLSSGEEVALKIPYFQYESDVVFHQRFLREEEIGQRITHPNIVRVLTPKEKSRLYFAMEFVPGRSLAEVLAEQKPFAKERALSIAIQLCEALAYLEEHGIVHRDVKPGNVHVLPTGEVKLLDFGIALMESARRLTWAGPSHAVGSPDYMAPEQIRGKRGDARTDVYALATLLYEMLTGRLPHEEAGRSALLRSKLHGDPTPPSRPKADIDKALEAVIERGLARDPRDRQGSARQMLSDLRSPASAARPLSSQRRRSRAWPRPGRTSIALAVGLTILAGLGSLVWLSTLRARGERAQGGGPGPVSTR